MYLWYIDDIFIIWKHGMESFLAFIDYLSTYSDNLKFTHQVSMEQVSYLDTLVKLEDNCLATDLFYKVTD